MSMVFLEYEQYKAKYLDALGIYNEILMEKERIMTKTMPSAIRYDKDITTTGVPEDNPLESYVMELEKLKIDERLEQVKSIVDDRLKLLNYKKDELMMSQDIHDKVYRMKFIEGYGINRIAKVLHYSRAQIYRIYGEINRKCKHETK